ncbi:NAD(P)/FAD-dependent oxidoreductase [Acinetobacter tianfuensis]|uniref:NAD(P)/FAD-dependent oxidoreductase n=1 Tax=Acinetobacter tianfuensis TaxID=2419603 RepID=A0A3A8ERQ5_9GAMM|nr:NAD(P)/FAD-dependent oxidoreductase [Acinetobacter tianfuensis]RKG31093.1 NAD(P)/FAD-dependent oxidoreductase [Acinetobacter tianfuensis]
MPQTLNTEHSALHKIIIVGGGAGGLELATMLGSTLGKTKKAQITLVDLKLNHVWKPLLHEIAAGTMNANDEATNYYAHAAKHHYEFVLGKLVDVLPAAKQVQLHTVQTGKYGTEGQTLLLDYDTLVLAVGSVSNDFGTAGVQEYCHYLDSLQQAEVFQQDLLHLYLDAQNQTAEHELNIAIIGAGATGVELSAELVQAKINFYKYGLNKIHPKKVSITLIEGSERILPALPEQIAEHAHKQLTHMKIDVLTGKRVEKVDAERIYFNDGSSIPAAIKVWAAGIKAPEVIANLKGFNQDRMGRLDVYATLQTKSDPNIFAFGDCAHCQPRADEPVLGPRAQVASQQAAFLAEALKARIKGKQLPMFEFSDKGSLVSLSKNKAVGELLGQVNVQGFVAKSMYVSLYRMHQAAIYGYTHAGLLTAKDFVTRKITPKIKLH